MRGVLRHATRTRWAGLQPPAPLDAVEKQFTKRERHGVAYVIREVHFKSLHKVLNPIGGLRVQGTSSSSDWLAPRYFDRRNRLAARERASNRVDQALWVDRFRDEIVGLAAERRDDGF